MSTSDKLRIDYERGRSESFDGCKCDTQITSVSHNDTECRIEPTAPPEAEDHQDSNNNNDMYNTEPTAPPEDHIDGDYNNNNINDSINNNTMVSFLSLKTIIMFDKLSYSVLLMNYFSFSTQKSKKK